MVLPKITLLGSGQIGSVLAILIAKSKLGVPFLYDVVEGMPQGKSLDLNHMGTIFNLDINTSASNDSSILEGSDVVVVTAGVPRKPGMSRDDLIKINSSIMSKVAQSIKTYCSNAFVVCITNPLDAMVYQLQKESGLPAEKVVGMAGALDTARFRYFLSEALNISSEDISTMVLGGHGDEMVPLQRYTSVGGISLNELINIGKITQEKVDEIIKRTRTAGGEIVNLLKVGSAYHAPAAAAFTMIESYLHDKKRIIPSCAKLNGQYGCNGYYAGVPTIIGKNGVEEIIELQLTDNERIDFERSKL